MATSMPSISATPSAAAAMTAVGQLAAVTAGAKADPATKARIAAQDFEAVFLNSMFSQMLTEVGGDGPFGGSPGIGVWRSFLTEQYAKSFAATGGIGLADPIRRALLAQQEARLPTP